MALKNYILAEHRPKTKAKAVQAGIGNGGRKDRIFRLAGAIIYLHLD
jgi:hypothetical protein